MSMVKKLPAIFVLSFLAAISVSLPAFAQIEYFPSPYENNPNANATAPANTNNGILPYGSTQNNGAFTVNWTQPTISWGQLQNIFLTHPNVPLFIIHFPNGFNWKVDPVGLQSLYTNMVGTTTNMGLIGAADLVFSSATEQLTITCCVAYTSQPYTR